MDKKILFLAIAASMLFKCGNHDPLQDPVATSSSSDGLTSSSSGSGENPSSGDGALSSSSGNALCPSEPITELPPQSTCTPSSTGGEDLLSIAYSGLCEGFNPNAASTHLGKPKKQICDERDGEKYYYVPIGRQIWLAENLRYDAEGTMGRCYGDDSENCKTLGVMYTFQEMFCRDPDGCLHESRPNGVVDPDKLDAEIACPYGWHLPSTTELEELWANADPNFVPGSDASGTGKNSAATKLKAVGWGDGTDELGFSAKPGGFCGGGCGGTPSGNIDQTYWWHKGFGAPVPLTKSWRMTAGAVVDDAFQSYGTSRFYTRCLKNSQQSFCPETPPQALACVGCGAEGQKCHYGKWKNYFTDDRDGQQYPYVEIPVTARVSLTWMAANLNYNAPESVCLNELDANCALFGRLYNYETAAATKGTNTSTTGPQGICPDGWHLPSSDEWLELLAAVGGTGTGMLAGAGTILKAKSGWPQNGTDDFGFAALPGSYGISNLGFGTAKGGFWWSATTQAANGAVIRHIGPTSANAKSVDNDKSRLYSVRCVKNRR